MSVNGMEGFNLVQAGHGDVHICSEINELGKCHLRALMGWRRGSKARGVTLGWGTQRKYSTLLDFPSWHTSF